MRSSTAPIHIAPQAAAVGALLHKRLLPAAVLYTLAINHKHMLLYFAPAFFSTMLGACFTEATPRAARAPRAGAAAPPVARLAVSLGGVRRVMQLGLAVLATSWFVWLPFVQDPAVAEQVRARSGVALSGNVVWLPPPRCR